MNSVCSAVWRSFRAHLRSRAAEAVRLLKGLATSFGSNFGLVAKSLITADRASSPCWRLLEQSAYALQKFAESGEYRDGAAA